MLHENYFHLSKMITDLRNFCHFSLNYYRLIYDSCENIVYNVSTYKIMKKIEKIIIRKERVLMYQFPPEIFSRIQQTKEMLTERESR